MKNYFFLIYLLSLGFVYPQENVINTAVPFLMISTDARSGGMGEVGVSTSQDVYSQYWNPSKYAFAEVKSGFGVSYSPWMNSLLENVFLGNINYYVKIDNVGSFATSFKYFSLGNIEKIDIINNNIESYGEFLPRELAFDVSYSMMLGKVFSMGLAMRYIYSNISDRTLEENQGYSPGHSIAIDISGFYQNEDKNLRAGFNISNIGPGISYGSGVQQSYNSLPTNLRLGVSYDIDLGSNTYLTLVLETNKLLVPTPQVASEGDTLEIEVNNSGLLANMIRSLYDAPGGFSEELKEYTLHFGAEYNFKNSFFFRSGYMYENPDKGYRTQLNIGTGIVYKYLKFDFSYLFSLSKYQTPLDNGLRLSLEIDLQKFNILDL